MHNIILSLLFSLQGQCHEKRRAFYHKMHYFRPKTMVKQIDCLRKSSTIFKIAPCYINTVYGVLNSLNMLPLGRQIACEAEQNAARYTVR